MTESDGGKLKLHNHIDELSQEEESGRKYNRKTDRYDKMGPNRLIGSSLPSIEPHAGQALTISVEQLSPLYTPRLYSIKYMCSAQHVEQFLITSSALCAE